MMTVDEMLALMQTIARQQLKIAQLEAMLAQERADRPAATSE